MVILNCSYKIIKNEIFLIHPFLRIKIKNHFQIIFFAICLSIPSFASAQGSSSIELVYSDAFDDRGRDDQSLVTYMQSNTWSFGDSFYFIDLLNLGNFENAGTTYIEWGPRLSLGKILFDKPINFGLIKDIYLIGELDYLHNKWTEKVTVLGGLSVDLAIPNFQFFKVHLFNRNDPTLEGHTQQVTFSWSLPFTLWSKNFSFLGFFDYTDSEGGNASSYQGQPQLLWKLNEKVSIGLEYLYWHNRGGRAGFNESAMQGVFKVNF